MGPSRLWIGALLAGVALALAPAVAGAAPVAQGPPIGPDQAFTALVNDNTGAAHPVTIHMACFGPDKPGRQGHPMAGQTLTVAPAASVVDNPGNTGPDGHQIGVFFGPPPPGASATAGPVVFTHYGTRLLPRSSVLPCAGPGHALFVPLPLTGGRDVSVPVVYVDQP